MFKKKENIYMNNTQKIQDIIKLIRDLNMGEIVDLNAALMVELGIDASMLSGPTGGSASTGPVEEVIKNIMLVEAKDRIGTIKGIRAKLGCTLGEASGMYTDVIAGKPLLLQENAKPVDLEACQAFFKNDKGDIAGVVQLVSATA